MQPRDLKTKAKESTVCPSACALHATGAIGSANAIVPSKAFVAAHERLHDLVDRQRRAPGGSANAVADVARLRASIADFADRLGDCRTPRALAEMQAHIDRQRCGLEQREAYLATLPEEAKVEPLVLVQRAEEALAALRNTPDLEKLREAALAVRELKAKALAVQKQRIRMNEQIAQAITAAAGAVGMALLESFGSMKQAVADLCAAPELEEIPETFDVAAFVGLWRKAENLAAVSQGIGVVLRPSDLLDAVPPGPVGERAAHAVGLSGGIEHGLRGVA